MPLPEALLLSEGLTWCYFRGAALWLQIVQVSLGAMAGHFRAFFRTPSWGPLALEVPHPTSLDLGSPRPTVVAAT